MSEIKYKTSLDGDEHIIRASKTCWLCVREREFQWICYACIQQRRWGRQRLRRRRQWQRQRQRHSSDEHTSREYKQTTRDSYRWDSCARNNYAHAKMLDFWVGLYNCVLVTSSVQFSSESITTTQIVRSSRSSLVCRNAEHTICIQTQTRHWHQTDSQTINGFDCGINGTSRIVVCAV